MRRLESSPLLDPEEQINPHLIELAIQKYGEDFVLHLLDYASHCDKPCDFIKAEGWPDACARCDEEDPQNN